MKLKVCGAALRVLSARDFIGLGSAARAVYALVQGAPPPLAIGQLGALLTIGTIYLAATLMLIFFALRTRWLRRRFAQFHTICANEFDAIAAFPERRSLPTVLIHWRNLVSVPRLNRSLASWLAHSLRTSEVSSPQSVQGRGGQAVESIVKECLELLESRRAEVGVDAV